MEILERLSRMEKVEAIALLKGHYDDFCAAIDATLRNTVRLDIVPSDDSPHEALLCEKASQLRTLGYAKFESLMPRDSLDVARAFAKILPGRAEVLGVRDKMVNDAQLGGTFWGRHASGFNTRIAFRTDRVPVFLQPILSAAHPCDRIIGKAIGAAGIAIARNLLIIDNLRPTETFDFQWWHFDRLFEQYKVMIFLDDITADNGPMRILPRTHGFTGARRIYDFCNYSEPFHGADPGYNAYKDRLDEIVCAEGRAGDAFIFDTKLFHAHGRPTVAERLTATIYYQPPPTPLNLFYSKYQPEGQSENY